jgi:hypothetical protein
VSNDTFALSYRDRDSAFFFIPTVPPARKWRGPFQNEFLMQRAMESELGADVTDIRTTMRPEFLK